MNIVTKTFKLFGITVWSHTVTTQIDEELVYKKLSDRFIKEMEAALTRTRGV